MERKTMFDMQKIGRKISELRKSRNMTQMALADALGISFQAVSNWERGESMPDIAKLGRFSGSRLMTSFAIRARLRS